MDSDTTLLEELTNARQEWKRVKFYHNTDPRKQACLARIRAAEQASKLRNINGQAPTSTINQPSGALKLNNSDSLEVKKELVELNFFGSGGGVIEGSNRENAMDVDAMFDKQASETTILSSPHGHCMDVDHTPLFAGTSVQPSTETKRDGSLDEGQRSKENSKLNTETSMDMDAMHRTEPLDTSTSGSDVGHGMDVDNTFSKDSAESPQTNILPNGLGTFEDIPSQELHRNKASNSSVDIERLLAQGRNEQPLQALTAQPNAKDVPVPHDTLARDVNVATPFSEDCIGSSAGTSSEPSVKKVPPAGALVRKTSTGAQSVLSQDVGGEEWIDNLSNDQLEQRGSTNFTSFEHNPDAEHCSPSDVPNVSEAENTVLSHNTTSVIANPPLSEVRVPESILRRPPEEMTLASRVYTTTSFVQTSFTASDQTPSEEISVTRPYYGSLIQGTSAGLVPSSSRSQMNLNVNEPLEHALPQEIPVAGPSVHNPPTYRVVGSSSSMQQQPLQESIPQTVWTLEEGYPSNFGFSTNPIVPNIGHAMSDSFLGMARMTPFGPGNDENMFHHEPLFTMPDNDGTEFKTDMEQIAPYSGPEFQTHIVLCSDEEAIKIFSSELDTAIARLPDMTLYNPESAFKLGDIDWDGPTPPFSRVPGDSDLEHRLRSELYVAKAAWMRATAYSKWFQKQQQVLQELAAKGISDVPAYMQTWQACEADTRAVLKRAEGTKVRVDEAQREMDMCFKGKSKTLLEFAVEELRDRIFSEEEIDPNELFILRKRLIEQQKRLQEILEEEERRAELEDSDGEDNKRARIKNKDDDTKDLPYLKMSDEDKIDMEEKARKAFWKFVKLASRKNPSQQKLNAAASDFNYSYRRTARTIRDFLREAGTTCRASSLLMLTTYTPNLFCRFHHLRHAYKACDSLIKFRGIGFPKGAKPKGKESKRQPRPNATHMDCGCLIDDGLFEMYFWKTLTAQSTNPRLSAMIYNMGTGVIPCNIRAFWVAQFKSTTGLTMDDLYNLSTDEAIRRTTLTAKMIIKSLSQIRNDLNIGVSLVFSSPKDEEAFRRLITFEESESADNE